MSESVLITGASGFLGFHLVKSALEKNLTVYAAVRKNSQVDHLKELCVKYVYLDYESISELKKVLSDNSINYIIHAAGVTKAVKQEDYNKVNATYSVNLAKAAETSGNNFKKMVFISSLAAAGPLSSANSIITEETNPSPVTAYGRSKLLAETELSKIDIPVSILRPTAIYGPRDKDIFIIIKTLNKGLDPYMGNFLQELSFVHAKDVADVAVQALFLNKVGTYNISDGYRYNRYQFADTTKKLLGKKAIRFHVPMTLIKLLAYLLETANGWLNKPAVINREKLHELAAKNWACDISKAKGELNYTPQFNLESGLKNSIEWYRQNKLL
jgi:nucleoside-diphosphate-sugar epimerase